MYKISDFSKKTGISIETLRYYDKIDFFKPLYTDIFSGYRYYIESQAEDMKKVQKLKEVGLSLQEISDFIKTKDINILLSKREEFMKKVEEINMIMRDKPNKYEIREADYRKYIEINGTRRATCPAALEIVIITLSIKMGIFLMTSTWIKKIVGLLLTIKNTILMMS